MDSEDLSINEESEKSALKCPPMCAFLMVLAPFTALSKTISRPLLAMIVQYRPERCHEIADRSAIDTLTHAGHWQGCFDKHRALHGIISIWATAAVTHCYT